MCSSWRFKHWTSCPSSFFGRWVLAFVLRRRVAGRRTWKCGTRRLAQVDTHNIQTHTRAHAHRTIKTGLDDYRKGSTARDMVSDGEAGEMAKWRGRTVRIKESERRSVVSVQVSSVEGFADPGELGTNNQGGGRPAGRYRRKAPEAFLRTERVVGIAGLGVADGRQRAIGWDGGHRHPGPGIRRGPVALQQSRPALSVCLLLSFAVFAADLQRE